MSETVPEFFREELDYYCDGKTASQTIAGADAFYRRTWRTIKAKRFKNVNPHDVAIGIAKGVDMRMPPKGHVGDEIMSKLTPIITEFEEFETWGTSQEEEETSNESELLHLQSLRLADDGAATINRLARLASETYVGKTKSHRHIDEIDYQQFCFMAGSVDWLWWPEAWQVTDGNVITSVALGICRSEKEILLVSSHTGLFFDAGEDLKPSEIQQRLIECATRDKALAKYSTREKIVVESDLNVDEDPLEMALSNRDVRPIRAFKNLYSAEIILVKVPKKRKSEGIPKSMMTSLNLVSTLFAKLRFLKNSSREAFYRLSSSFDYLSQRVSKREDLEDKISLLRKFRGESLHDCYVGYLSRRQEDGILISEERWRIGTIWHCRGSLGGSVCLLR